MASKQYSALMIYLCHKMHEHCGSNTQIVGRSIPVQVLRCQLRFDEYLIDNIERRKISWNTHDEISRESYLNCLFIKQESS